jgi:hypothetical protein
MNAGTVLSTERHATHVTGATGRRTQNKCKRLGGERATEIVRGHGATTASSQRNGARVLRSNERFRKGP